MKSISIFGSYNRNSIGDKAILISLLHLLNQEADAGLQFDIIVHDVSAIKEELADYPWYDRVCVRPLTSRAQSSPPAAAGDAPPIRREPNRFTYPLLTSLSVVRSAIQLHRDFADTSSGLIVGGGNLIMDLYPTWPARLDLLTRQFSKKKRPIAFAGVGAFPISSRVGNLLLSRSVRRAELVYTRDEATARHIEEQWHKQAIHRPDLAFSYPCEAKATEPFRQGPSTIIVNVGPLYAGNTPLIDEERQQDYLSQLSTVLHQYWLQRKDQIDFLLLDTNYPTDREFALALQDRLRSLGVSEKAIAYDDRLLSCSEIIDRLQGASFAITTRLHAGILALRSGLPVIAIAYQPKVTDVFAGVDLDHATIPLDQIQSQLMNKIDSLTIDPQRYHLDQGQLDSLDLENRDVISRILSTMQAAGSN